MTTASRDVYDRSIAADLATSDDPAFRALFASDVDGVADGLEFADIVRNATTVLTDGGTDSAHADPAHDDPDAVSLPVGPDRIIIFEPGDDTLVDTEAWVKADEDTVVPVDEIEHQDREVIR